jgi:putative membrane-bound dehydrogenase-like protein
MRHFTVAALLLPIIAVTTRGADKPAETPKPRSNQIKLNGHTFTLPDGFTIELVAGPPLVQRPISADFDEEGRLYVSDSSGTNEKVEIQLQKKPHRIVRLVDSNGTGKFDKSTVFADQMAFPEGMLWHGGSIYVAAPPSIWKLTDADGDGVAEKREEWFQGKTLGHCANDLHGPYLGPDGWIYWTKGAWAKQDYTVNGKPWTTRASHIFRCKPDGTGLEPIMTGGMDNPVGIAFTATGDRILTNTFFQFPAGGKRDGLIHAIYGGVYGKDHAPIYEHPWTGPTLMPVLAHLGAAAPCGIRRYESAEFGKDYQDNFFTCCFNMHKVTRSILTPEGATYKSKEEDFLTSDNLDFHPTDVVEDADGSLLVIDTGGWYKICCPTSQLQKPDVLGAIYRVKRVGAHKVEDPRGKKLAWNSPRGGDYLKRLDDPRPAVQRRAIERLASKDVSGEGFPELFHSRKKASTASATARRNAVWVLARQSSNDLLGRALDDPDARVRAAALHVMSLHRFKSYHVDRMIELLKGDTPANARAAAEVMGRTNPEPPSLEALLRIAASTTDRVMEHSAIYALIEMGHADATGRFLTNENPRIRRAALIALDGMKGGNLKPETVAKELSSGDGALKEAAWWIAGRHPEWGGQLAGFLRDRLIAKDLKPAERTELVAQLARFSGTPAVQDMLAEKVRDASAGDARVLALQAIAQSSLKESPAAWLEAVAQVLGEPAVVGEAVATARRIRPGKQKTEKLTTALLAIANDDGKPVAVRIGALAAVPGGLPKVEAAHFTLLRANVGGDQPVAVRSSSAEVLSRARLSAPQLLALTETMKTAGPMEVERLLEAYGVSTDEVVGLALLAALKDSTSRASLRADAIKTRLAKYSPKVRKEAEALYDLLNVDAAKQRVKLEELLTNLKPGDVRRGQAVFNSTKAACSSCHAIGYLGGNIGPDLTRIGGIRSERDLLEAIVFPSASFVRSYEPVVVTTNDGKTYNGLVRKDAPDEMVLVMNATQEVRIPRNQIEDVQPSKVSIMPAGLDQQLTPQELADVVAFLRACK